MWLVVSSLVSLVGGFVMNNITQQPTVSIVNPQQTTGADSLKYHIGAAVLLTATAVWFLARKGK